MQKCNPDEGIMRELALAGCGFDVASSAEMDKALALGVSSDRIIYANPLVFHLNKNVREKNGLTHRHDSFI